MSEPDSYREKWVDPHAFAHYDERRSLVAPALQVLFAGSLMAAFEPEDTLVEIGAGAGALSHYAAPLDTAFHWIETEQNPSFLTLPRTASLTRVGASAAALPFAPGSIDGIIGLGVFDTLSPTDLRNLASEAHGSLRSDGKVLHLLDMSPDYNAEIKIAAERGLFPLITKGEEVGAPMGLAFAALKNLPRRIDRLPIQDSIRRVFSAIVKDPETNVALANGTGILQYLGITAGKFGMIVEEHPSWYDYMGSRFATAFEANGFTVKSNELITATVEVDQQDIPPKFVRKGVTDIVRKQGFVDATSVTNGKRHDDMVRVTAESHLFVAQKAA